MFKNIWTSEINTKIINKEKLFVDEKWKRRKRSGVTSVLISLIELFIPSEKNQDLVDSESLIEWLITCPFI